jgi:hypothetical protein
MTKRWHVSQAAIRHASGAGLAAAVACALAGGGFLASAQAASKGWQGIATYTVPTNTGSLEYSYPCPSEFPIAWSGGYEFVDGAQTDEVYVTANGPRLDEGPSTGFNVWGWHFFWPSGSPAGTQIYFDVNCQGIE